MTEPTSLRERAIMTGMSDMQERLQSCLRRSAQLAQELDTYRSRAEKYERLADMKNTLMQLRPRAAPVVIPGFTPSTMGGKRRHKRARSRSRRARSKRSRSRR